MNRREIDAMMRDLPSQRQEPLGQKMLACASMVAILVFVFWM